MNLPSSGTAARRLFAAGLFMPLALMAGTAQAQESQWRSGEHLYKSVCGHCHAPEVGVGTVIQGRNLPAEYITFIVRNGFNAMPAFPASFIDDESLAKVTEYLDSLPPVTPPER